MKILHYSLGFPPFRTGGMTSYCIDLILEQVQLGHEVSLLWPGTINNYSSSLKIKQRKGYRLKNDDICKSFEVINPLPIPLLDGISNINAFTKEKDIEPFLQFFSKNKFDVLHIHTLMGLPKECLIAARGMKIKIVFTSHDYFGICPKCSLMQGNKICIDDHLCKDCVNCNKTAMSLRKIQILQSHLYRNIKNTKFITNLRRKHIKSINNYYENDNIIITEKSNANIENEYVKLREYYKDIFNMINIIIFNSENTKKIYNKYIDTSSKDRIIAISNSMIQDNRKLKKVHNKIHFGYLGPASARKGFYFLLDVLDELYNNENKQFELHIYNGVETGKEYIISHDPYTKNEISDVMNNVDILIVPSLWYETFGFTVLEALSFGVPVIVSENVGAKDLINSKNGMIFSLNGNDLKEKIKYCINNTKIIEELNKNICEIQNIKTMKQHTNEIIKLYQD